jgi:nitrate/nitrite-specific signal transduction histidine kinase
MFSLVATSVVAAILAWRLQRIVSAPLLRLTHITHIVTGERDYSVRAVNEGDDEVGELVDGFNEMLDHIQHRDQIVEQHRQTLEHTVEARTAELTANVERFRVLVESTRTIPGKSIRAPTCSRTSRRR